MYKDKILEPVYSRDVNDTRVSPETRDVVFNKHSVQDGKHVSPSNNGKLQIGTDGIQVRMIKGIDEEGFKRVVAYGLRATTGIDFELPMDETEDTDEMLRGGLQQALESDRIVFAVTGVSRACTHQLVRTRKAAFNQQSQRATFFGNNFEIRVPESVWVSKDPKVLAVWLNAIEATREAYRVATEANISYQDARLIMPEGTTNAIICSYDPREWLNTLAYRGCYMFQWEISHVFREMRRQVVEKYPWLEPHAKITCEKTGKCHFQGWESTEAQCPLPMAREDNRVFRSERYAIGGELKTPYSAIATIQTYKAGEHYSLDQMITMMKDICGEDAAKFDEAQWVEGIHKAADAKRIYVHSDLDIEVLQ